jgi:hypothetical protein
VFFFFFVTNGVFLTSDVVGEQSRFHLLGERSGVHYVDRLLDAFGRSDATVQYEPSFVKERELIFRSLE